MQKSIDTVHEATRFSSSVFCFLLFSRLPFFSLPPLFHFILSPLQLPSVKPRCENVNGIRTWPVGFFLVILCFAASSLTSSLPPHFILALILFLFSFHSSFSVRKLTSKEKQEENEEEVDNEDEKDEKKTTQNNNSNAKKDETDLFAQIPQLKRTISGGQSAMVFDEQEMVCFLSSFHSRASFPVVSLLAFLSFLQEKWIEEYLQPFTCSVCFDESESTKGARLSCGHTLCLSCWQSFLANKIDDVRLLSLFFLPSCCHFVSSLFPFLSSAFAFLLG
jgi:hypothetical protein